MGKGDRQPGRGVRVARAAATRCATLALALTGCDGQEARAADRPLGFDHRAHKKAGVACVECHRGVGTETWAGVPTLDDCLACHALGPSEHADIARVRAMTQKGHAPDWGGLYRLAAHARFSHRAHAHAKMACSPCHGKTGEREVSSRENPRFGEELMDWCISCHVEKKAATDCLTCHL